ITIWRSAPAPAFAARVARHSPTDFAFSAVSLHEQFLGVHSFLARARTTAQIVRGYEMLHRLWNDYRLAIVLPFEAAAATEFDKLRGQRIRIGTMDLRIAAVALAHGLTLLTRNSSDFGKVPGLAMEDWTT